jgi:nucleoside-diphosphate-sugar epimerase
MEVTSLRPAVVWGRGDTTVLPIMAKLSASPMGIPMCGDGSNIEATTHIDNLVGAIILALTAPAASGHAYLIGDAFRIGWKAFLAAQVEATGVRPGFCRVPKALAIPASWMLDHAAGALGLPVPLAYFGVRTSLTSRVVTSARACEELGYSPRVGLKDGLADLRAWVAEIGGPGVLMRGGGVAGSGDAMKACAERRP